MANAEYIYESLQIVLEFMDKGVKGLLTGDLSVYLIKKIQENIEAFEKEFKDVSS